MKKEKSPREEFLEYRRKAENYEYKAIIGKDSLSPSELWNLYPKNYKKWCNKHYYPKLLTYFNDYLEGFSDWKKEYNLSDDEIINLGITNFLSHKQIKRNKYLYITKYHSEDYDGLHVLYKKPKDRKNIFGKNVINVIQKVFISYSDWCNRKGIPVNILNIRSRSAPGHEEERVYLEGNFELLKMGGVSIPDDGIYLLDKGKHLEFVNLSNLTITGKIYWRESPSLRCSYCATDNLHIVNSDIALPIFEYCSLENIYINKSQVDQIIFYECRLFGEINNSNLRFVEIYGGAFNPIFRDTHIYKVDAFDVEHSKTNMSSIYKTLKKIYSNQGDDYNGIKYYLKEKDVERKSSNFVKKIRMTISSIYWGYGRRPGRIIFISLFFILGFSLLYYYFFPEYFLINTPNDAISFWDSLYISAVSFTTLGFGDVNPYGIAKLMVAFESLFGAMSIGFLVAGFSNFKY